MAAFSTWTLLSLAGAVLCSTAAAHASPVTTTPSGLKYSDDVVGNGTVATPGKQVSVDYTGWLNDKGAKGNKFDSSLDRHQVFQFTLGQGRVIAGWEEGVAGMKVGGKRTLYIPSKLGYGERGAPPVIPPNSDLIFEVELKGIQ